jgi:hypothetical protein
VDDRAELAWAGLLRIVRRHGYWDEPKEWPDPAMRRAAMELYGGWCALCERLPSEGASLAYAAKQFKATYAAHVRDTARQGALPPSCEDARAALTNLRAELDRCGLPAGKL